MSKFIDDIPNTKNIAKFYSLYYGKVLKNSKSYFPMLSDNASKILVMKLCDFLPKFEENIKSNEDVEITARNISMKELGALQYLAGYVMFTIYKKLKFTTQEFSRIARITR